MLVPLTGNKEPTVIALKARYANILIANGANSIIASLELFFDQKSQNVITEHARKISSRREKTMPVRIKERESRRKSRLLVFFGIKLEIT